MRKAMTSFNSFHLKLIAIITMTIDHIGVYLYPETDLFRMIGRICFPLIAFLLANGYKHTKDFNQYIKRLITLAIVIQIALFALGDNYINIFFTLVLGLLIIEGLEKKQYTIAIPGLLLPYIVSFDYGYYGILMILIMYYFKNYMILAIVGLNLIFIEVVPLTSFVYFGVHPLQIYSLFALPLILMYNGKEGKKMQYFFYLYYPVHLLLILLIKELIYA